MSNWQNIVQNLMEAEDEILKVCHILLHVPTKIGDTKCTIVFQILITCMKGF